jgi:SAM-dependent methyltransferase
MNAPEYLKTRRADVRWKTRWAPFSYVARQLEATVGALVNRAQLAPGARVLDYGCADQPYRSLLPAGVSYVGADLLGNPVADIELLSDGTVPIPDASVDMVLSSQVLEHVADPTLYLHECLRVTRPGGSLVLTTHGIMYDHADPHDYWRWTGEGLRKVVTDSGFAVVELTGILGLAAAALQLFQDGTGGRLPRSLRRPYVFVMQSLISLMDRLYSDQTRASSPLVLAILAVKPS